MEHVDPIGWRSSDRDMALNFGNAERLELPVVGAGRAETEMRRLFLLLCLTLAPVSEVHADECANAMSQRAMDDCAGKSFKASDAQLNALYKQIEQRLKSDADTTKLLVAAQRAWVAFRDAECVLSSSGSAGGSVYPMIYAMCLDRLTKARTDDLKGYLKCEEGDMSCPVPAAK